jgi:hypothetical protein
VAFVGALAITPLLAASAIMAAPALNYKSGHTQNHPVTFTGMVIKVDSNQRFDIRVGQKTYSVKTAVGLPRSVKKGDLVRVSGRKKANFIDHARVEILRSASSKYQNESFTGIITTINSDRRFDLRINGKIFHVTAAGQLPRYLKRGDKVRITGRKSGGNITNAQVVRLNN